MTWSASERQLDALPAVPQQHSSFCQGRLSFSFFTAMHLGHSWPQHHCPRDQSYWIVSTIRQPLPIQSSQTTSFMAFIFACVCEHFSYLTHIPHLYRMHSDHTQPSRLSLPPPVPVFFCFPISPSPPFVLFPSFLRFHVNSHSCCVFQVSTVVSQLGKSTSQTISKASSLCTFSSSYCLFLVLKATSSQAWLGSQLGVYSAPPLHYFSFLPPHASVNPQDAVLTVGSIKYRRKHWLQSQRESRSQRSALAFIL